MSFSAEAVATEAERRLRAAGTPARAVAEKAYLKSSLEFAGVPVPVTRKIIRELLPRRGGSRDQVVAVAVALWARPVHECRMAATMLLADHVGLLQAEDSGLVERLIRESRTWALVDTLAVHVMGPLVESHPELTAVLDRWASDDDFWIRRSALLALLGPLRRGSGDFDRFGRYADSMLEEREFFIRKAIGWVLRDTGRRRPELISAWLEPRAERASGVTLREAVKPLSPRTAERLLAARSAKPGSPAGGPAERGR